GVGTARRRADAQGRPPRAGGRQVTCSPLAWRLGGLAALFLFLPVACGGPDARSPQGPRADLPAVFGDAFRADATGDPRVAVKAYLDVVRAAARADGDPWQVPALEASLDALATRTMPSLGEASRDAALAWRTGEGASIAQELGRMD